MGGTWPEQPLLDYAESDGGTTARRQRYHRSTATEQRQDPAVQPLGRAVQPLGTHSKDLEEEGGTLSTRKGGKDKNEKGLPYSIHRGFPLECTGSLRPKR